MRSDSSEPAAAGPEGEKPSGPEIDAKMLESLVCPASLGPLEYDRRRHVLISRNARLVYEIRDGVPIMLVSEAKELTDDAL